VQKTEVSNISLDTPDYSQFVLPLMGIKHAIAIDFDPVDQQLYWTDDEVSYSVVIAPISCINVLFPFIRPGPFPAPILMALASKNWSALKLNTPMALRLTG